MNIWAKTDCGVIRETNQDSFTAEISEPGRQGFFAVCDGMGGAQAGNVASLIAAQAFSESLKKRIKPAMSKNYIKEIVIEAVNNANMRIYDTAAEDSSLVGMGTTIVGGVISGGDLVIANVGDSRAYIINDRGISQITTDHSVVMELVARGDITEAEAAVHPNKNLITRALGAEKGLQIDTFELSVSSGQYVLCCSDGLSNLVNDQEILYEILHGGQIDGCCDRLIQLANSRGGFDNITVLLMEV